MKISQLTAKQMKAATLSPALKAKLGWTPDITVQQMCAEMVAADLADAQRHSLLKQNGYTVNVSVE